MAEIGVFLDPPEKDGKCNFIHREVVETWEVPATSTVRFQLSSSYATVIRVCDRHLKEMREVGGV